MDEDLLARLRAGGSVHSEGRFTVAPARAQAWLARCRLPSPELALLKAAQAAIAGGAGEVWLETDPFQASVRWRGAVPRREDLEDLDGFLMDARGREDLRELALAVNDARGRARRVHLQARPLTLIWEPGGRQDVRPSPPTVRPDSVALVTWRPWSQVLPWRSAVLLAREGRLLREACAFAPVPTWHGGQRLDGGDREVPEVEIYLVEPGPHAVWAPARSRAQLRPYVPPAWGGAEKIPCLAVLRLSPGARSEVRWVRHGVIVSREEVDLGRPGVTALASTRGLQVDLSGFQVVRDQAWEARIGYLREFVRHGFRGLEWGPSGG